MWDRSVAERILPAALALFAEHGYHATSKERIADAAGVTRGAFDYYYESKRYLLLVLVEPFVGALEELARRSGPGGHDDETVLRGYLDVLLAHDAVHRFVTNDSAVRADVDLGPRLRTAYGAVAAALTHGSPARDEPLRAACALGAVSAGVLHDADPGGSRPVILAIAEAAMRVPLRPGRDGP